MQKVRTAVIGVGMFGDTHARTYAESESAELVCVCDVDAQRAEKAANTYGCAWTTNSAEIANDPSIRIVSIATPDHLHRDVCLQMIEAGKDLLVEKPLATNIEDAEAITRAAKQKGIRLMTDFQNRWNPPLMAAKQAIESGEMGVPVSAYARLCNAILITKWLPWSGSSGPQWFLGPHIVDLVRWLFCQEAKSVYAVGRRGILKERGFDTYDAVQAQIKFEDAFATIDTAWILPPSWPALDFRLDFLGSKGKIELEPTKHGVAVASERYQTPFIGGRQDVYNHMFGFFREPILHFVDCVRHDKPCLVDLEDGLAITRIIVAIEQSIVSGKVVDL
jgi:predicted dehydrogenase